MLVVGLAHRKGEYQGKSYDNMVIYCTRPADTTKDEQGEISECIKIKYSEFPSIIQIGCEIRPIYDRFGRVVDIQMI